MFFSREGGIQKKLCKHIHKKNSLTKKENIQTDSKTIKSNKNTKNIENTTRSDFIRRITGVLEKQLRIKISDNNNVE